MSDIPLGSFEEQVLLAVIRTHRDAYGMAVRQEIESVSGRDVTIGAVYATLDRLEAKGLLESRRSPGARPRRVFQATHTGVAALADTRAMRQRLWQGIDLNRLLGDHST